MTGDWNNLSTLEAALEYAHEGMHVCPVVSPEYTLFGKRTGKMAFFGYMRKATTDPKTIEAWFTRHPQANVGIITGAISNCFVLDVDRKYGGLESLSRLPPIPHTWSVQREVVENISTSSTRIIWWSIHPDRGLRPGSTYLEMGCSSLPLPRYPAPGTPIAGSTAIAL